MSKKKQIIEYDQDKQKLYLDFLISDPTAFIRCQSILNDEHWHERLRPAVRFLSEYSMEHNVLPTVEQVEAIAKVKLDKIVGIQNEHTEWILKEVESFTRHRAMELVIMDGADSVSEGAYAEIEERLKEALTISINSDLGLTYWDNPTDRIQEMLDRQDMVPTGWRDLDQVLYGGFTKGALNVFAGGSGSGKSLALLNLALNWAYAGLNVIYFSIELSENLVATRLDSMVSNLGYREVFKNIDKVALSLNMARTRSGDLRIKKYPEAGTTSNHLRAYMQEYMIQTGKKIDAVCVDYLDIMYPNNTKINPSDLFIKDKFVSEELRALAGEFDVIMATASQLNRGSGQAVQLDHSHIAGGISKINTADNVFGIISTDIMKEQGIYELHMLKTRSSSGVGKRVELKYDNRTLRISDLDVDVDEEAFNSSSTSSISESIRNKLNSKKDDDGEPSDATKNAMMALMNKVNNK